MKIISWNLNSIRSRLEILKSLAETTDADVIALQETKAQDKDFPFDFIREELGYEHIANLGMKAYNGVAILSKKPFDKVEERNWVGKEDCRNIVVQIGDVEVNNIYVPAGGDEPDAEINLKFAHKLAFLDDISEWFEQRKAEYSDKKIVFCGDFNIAPMENDVWSHKQLLKVVSHTPIEVERFARLQKSLDWTSVARMFIPEDEKAYSWWSYRAKDWKKSNRGRLLDHFLITPSLKNSVQSYKCLDDFRSLVKPSDHAPIIMEIKD